jgi:hypothetical protein
MGQKKEINLLDLGKQRLNHLCNQRTESFSHVLTSSFRGTSTAGEKRRALEKFIVLQASDRLSLK